LDKHKNSYYDSRAYFINNLVFEQNTIKRWEGGKVNGQLKDTLAVK